MPQAEALDAALTAAQMPLDAVLDIDVPEEIVVRRLSGRRVCRTCGAIYHVENKPPKVEGVCDLDQGEVYQRDDDREEAIRQRLQVYAQATAPLTAYYREKACCAPSMAPAPRKRCSSRPAKPSTPDTSRTVIRE